MIKLSWKDIRKNILKMTHPKNIISSIDCFTDGSTKKAKSKDSTGIGGWGWVIYEKGDICNLEYSDYGGKMITTNQAMEAIAMAELLEFLSIGKSANIYSDSEYVLKGIIGNVKELTLLTSPPQGWVSSKIAVGYIHKVKKDSTVYNQSYWKIIPANDEIWWRIHKLLLKHLHGGSKLYFSWIKGHSNSIGNDRADELSNLYYKSNVPLK